MRVLVDCHCFDSGQDEGINTYIKGLYGELPALRPDVEFVFASRQGRGLESVFGNAPNVSYVTLSSRGRAGRMLREYPQLIRRLGIDWAHFQYFAPPVKNCRTIVTLHDILFEDFPENFPRNYRLTRRAIFRHSIRRADIPVTVSEYSRGRIAAHYGIEASRITVTPNAVSPIFFNVDREAARREIYGRGIRPFILNVGRIEPRKNQIAVVRAFHETGLAQRGLDLVLINKQAIAVPELESFIASLPATTRQRIHRIEGLKHEELPTWYGAADLFVFPSLGEGFGIPPLEAAATGTPTVCHNATAMGDYDFFGTNLADLSNRERLNNIVLNNVVSPLPAAERQRIAAAIRARYSWSASANTLANQLKP